MPGSEIVYLGFLSASKNKRFLNLIHFCVYSGVWKKYVVIQLREVAYMPMINTVHEMQALSEMLRLSGKRICLVPTMGALHDGHLALVREGCSLGDHLIVSVFVNPTQFGPHEDFAQYPRTLDEDREKLEAVADVDVTIFAPTVEDVYPGGVASNVTRVEVQQLDANLCGRYREGHFRGVTTVVSRLFNICKPHAAVFGLKDAQQFLILKRMVRDLAYDIQLVGVPTVREPDGLAKSSRNVYLNVEQRKQAILLFQAVTEAKKCIETGTTDTRHVIELMHSVLRRASQAKVQYVEVVETTSLQLLSHIEPGQEVLAAVAVFFGSTRLIDNVMLHSPL